MKFTNLNQNIKIDYKYKYFTLKSNYFDSYMTYHHT